MSDPVDNYVSIAQEACNMLLSNVDQENAGSTLHGLITRYMIS